jgi:hypothetical protein
MAKPPENTLKPAKQTPVTVLRFQTEQFTAFRARSRVVAPSARRKVNTLRFVEIPPLTD